MIEWVCFTTRWHSCLLRKAPATPTAAAGHRNFENRLTWLQVRAPWAPLRHSQCLINCKWLHIRKPHLTLLLCKSKVEKKQWVDFWHFGFPRKRSKLTCAQWEGFSYWLVERGCGLGREGIELAVKSMVCSGPRSCKTPNSPWNHGQAVPHSQHHFQKATGFMWCYGQYPNCALQNQDSSLHPIPLRRQKSFLYASAQIPPANTLWPPRWWRTFWVILFILLQQLTVSIW